MSENTKHFAILMGNFKNIYEITDFDFQSIYHQEKLNLKIPNRKIQIIQTSRICYGTVFIYIIQEKTPQEILLSREVKDFINYSRYNYCLCSSREQEAFVEAFKNKFSITAEPLTTVGSFCKNQGNFCENHLNYYLGQELYEPILNSIIL